MLEIFVDTGMELHPFSAFLPDSDWLRQNPGLLVNAKAQFTDFFAAGRYIRQLEPTLYVLRITNPEEVIRYGVAGLADTGEYGRDAGSIHPHELTLKAREQKQQQDYRSSKHLIKPILLTCPQYDALQKQLVKVTEQLSPILAYSPEPDFLIEVYALPAEGLAKWNTIINDLPGPVAVADGHHRISTAKILMNEIRGLERIPVVLIPANSLGIGSFIRSVSSVGEENIIEKLKEFFRISDIQEKEVYLPATPGEWLLAYRGKYYGLAAKNETTLTDPEWFDQQVLPMVFSIFDSTTDDRLVTTSTDGGIDSFKKMAVGKKHWHFLPPPIRSEDFFGKIESRGVFPPKSTRFYPRIPSGLLVYGFR